MDILILSDTECVNLAQISTAAAVPRHNYEGCPPSLRIQFADQELAKWYEGEDARRIWVGLGMGEWDKEKGTFTTPFDKEAWYQTST